MSNDWSHTAQVDGEDHTQAVAFKIPTRPASLRQPMATRDRRQGAFQDLPGSHRTFPSVSQSPRGASVDSHIQTRPDVKIASAPTEPLAMRCQGVRPVRRRGVAARYLSCRPPNARHVREAQSLEPNLVEACSVSPDEGTGSVLLPRSGHSDGSGAQTRDPRGIDEPM